MTGSRCLQCGAQLAVLRKLTGGGDFCSDAHRRTYQEELNRIALSRLMRVRPREEKTADPAADSHKALRSSPAPPAAPPAEPATPAVAGFIRTGLEGQNLFERAVHSVEPLPIAKTLFYPQHLFLGLNDLGALDGMVTTERPALSTGSAECNESSSPPRLAERISVAFCVEMCIAEPTISHDLAPVGFGTPEIHLGCLSESVLRPTGFNVEEEKAAEPVPPRAAVPRAITIRALEPAHCEIVQSLEALPLAPHQPQMPTLATLPLRSAITFAAPPKPAQKTEPEVAPPVRSVAPRPMTKAAPTPKSQPKSVEKAVESVAPKSLPVSEPLASAKTPAVETQDATPLSTTLTLGLSNSDMGSPVFRFWYSMPAKVKVTLIIGLLTVVIFSALSKKAEKAKIDPTAGLAANTPIAGFTGGSIAMGGGGWVTEWAGDPAGSKRGKQLTLYKPSMLLKDYRTEFVGQIETGSLGWIFRAKDPKNYYAMKIRIVRPGIEPGIVLTRYAVIDGLEGPHVDVPLRITARNDTLYRVKVEVQGAKFSTYIQGSIVDIWSDDRLTSGGFGFSNERAERANIRSVSVSF